MSTLLDEELLLSFHSTWANLQSDITDFYEALTKETLALAHSVASRISTIAQCYLDIQQEQKVLMDGLTNGVEEILDGLDEVFASKTSNTVHSGGDGLSPFIATAYRWLLDNVHNPYPSAQLKVSIAANFGCPQKSVDAWFISARRRIGWTSLCREQFRNCRADAVDAAYRALVRSDPSRPLPASVVQAFVVIKVNAEGLYSSTFSRSALAKDLDAVVKDLTSCDGQVWVQEKEKGTISRQKVRTQAYHNKQCFGSINSHLSSVSPPPVSAIPALVSSLSDESEDEEQLDVAPPLLAGHKRRTSSLDRECPVHSEQPKKRLCGNLTPMNEGVEASNSNPLEISPRVIVPRCRKRRLSEVDQQNLPKRPRGLPAAPRLQTVSDPLPRSAAFGESLVDNWFQTHFTTLFDLPAPVNCSDLDSSGQWEVELFNGYSIPPMFGKSNPLHFSSQSSTSLSSLKTSPGDTDLSGLDDLLLSFVTEMPGNSAAGTTSPISLPEDGSEVLSKPTQMSNLPLLDDWMTLFASPSPTFNDTPRCSVAAGYSFHEATSIIPTFPESVFSRPLEPANIIY